MVELSQITDKVIGLVVIAALVPVGLAALYATNTSGWDTATIAIWGIIGIVFIVALLKTFL